MMWTSSAVATWLYSNNMQVYARAFYDFQVDGPALLNITE